MPKQRTDLEKTANRNEVNAFLRKVALTPSNKPSAARGRLIFALDATASRAHLWDQACHIQGEMFKKTAQLGGLSIQLAYYRGYEEFYASAWHTGADQLLREMTAVQCLGGMTQLTKVLKHAVAETKRKKVQALVFVGDCFEEDPGGAQELAGQLGLLGVPVFMFQEGDDPLAETVYRQISKLSHGAYCRFDANSAQQLLELLQAVAIFAAGGRQALDHFGQNKSALIKQITGQLPKPKS